MNGLTFEWDPNKAAANLRKHGVSFEVAAEVFRDFQAMTWPDVAHSDDEDRELTLGSTQRGVILVVAHTDRSGKIRIISARKATKRERAVYANA
jgi:uncharacterized DUF497 family protein